MMSGKGSRPTRRVDGLLAVALDRPQAAAARARAILGTSPSPADTVIAEQALGIVLRDRGDTTTAVRHLDRALDVARSAALDQDVVADVLATLGVTQALTGNVQKGLQSLERARTLVPARQSARILTRLAYVLALDGRYREALEAINEAVAQFARAGDDLWLARSRSHRGLIRLSLGDTRRADDDFAQAEAWFERADQQFEYVMARHNRGLVAAAAAELPRALRLLDEAGQGYARLEVFVPELAIDQCAVLLAAGLHQDALQTADAALARARTMRGQGAVVAQLELVAARAALAAGHQAVAHDHAKRARALFASQRRELWGARAQLTTIEARLGREPLRPVDVRRTGELAARLDQLATDESTHARLLAARVAFAAGDTNTAARHLRAAAASRRRGSAIDRVTGWLAQAMLREVEGRPQGMLAACRRGLDVLDEYRLTLGATEARATATTHGRELVRIALRHAVGRREARLVVRWNERLRSTQWWLPAPVEDRDDAELATALAAVRHVSRQLAEHQGEEEFARRLRRRRDELEATVRARALRRDGLPKSGETTTRKLVEPQADGQVARRLRRRRDELEASVRIKALRRDGPPQLAAPGRRGAAVAPALGALVVELVEVDGTLYAATISGRRARLHEVGPVEAAVGAVQHAQTLLRRMARGAARHGDVLLAAAGRELEARLLGPASAEVVRALAAASAGDVSGDQAPADVVVVAPARLYAAPWTLLPALADRAVALAPSTALWARAATARPRDDGHVVLVSGPGLATGGGEIRPLAAAHPGPMLLTGANATAEKVLAALDGAALAHVAAHGVFRSDNPQFSALQLADGPLTVFDLERLARPPHRMVLASCDSGRMAPAGADELLGMVTCLVSLGTVGVLAPIAPVHDEATVRLMVELHAGLASGLPLARAALAARRRTAGDALGEATAAAFLVFGA